MTQSTVHEIKEVFSREFAPLIGKFTIWDFTLDKVRDMTDPSVNRPGVYVYWKQDFGVIKVGKHQRNARIRALEHIRDNTRNNLIEMSRLDDDPSCHLLLFTISHDSDIHWVLSLEYFFEKHLDPIIRSDRSG